MKNRITPFMLISFLYLLSSCQKTIMPTLTNSGPQLVIEGAVSDTTGPYHVNISRTANFYTDNVYSNVSGAAVTVTDVTAGISDVLKETAPGVYTTHTITGTPGNTYQLKVDLEGKTYLATSTMPQPVKLDSASINYNKTDHLRPVVNFQDPVGFTNYYKYSVMVNGIHLKRVQTFSDRLSNGKYIRGNMDVDTGEVKSGNLIKLSLVGVEHDVYNFLMEAENVAYNNNNLASPATPISNISGGCIGYFSAQTVSSKSVLVKK